MGPDAQPECLYSGADVCLVGWDTDPVLEAIDADGSRSSPFDQQQPDTALTLELLTSWLFRRPAQEDDIHAHRP